MSNGLTEHATETVKDKLIKTAFEIYEAAYEYYTKDTDKLKADERKKLINWMRELWNAIVDYEKRAHQGAPTIEAFLMILDEEDDLCISEIIAVCIGIIGLFKLTPDKLKALLNSLVIKAEPNQNIIVTLTLSNEKELCATTR